ncbi:Zinc finger CCCH domain-containing protein 8 [Halotydeus destructor]|nr:Zinc finger CCCH domain-containing protein 8 [Halotydeus destructor]
MTLNLQQTGQGICSAADDAVNSTWVAMFDMNKQEATQKQDELNQGDQLCRPNKNSSRYMSGSSIIEPSSPTEAAVRVVMNQLCYDAAALAEERQQEHSSAYITSSFGSPVRPLGPSQNGGSSLGDPEPMGPDSPDDSQTGFEPSSQITATVEEDEDGEELEEGELDTDDDDEPAPVPVVKVDETKESKSKIEKDKKSSRGSSKDKSSSSKSKDNKGDPGRRSSSTSISSKPKESSSRDRSSSSRKKRSRDGESDSEGSNRASKRTRDRSPRRRNSGSASEASGSEEEVSPEQFMKSMMEQITKMMVKNASSGRSKSPETKALQAMMEKMMSGKLSMSEFKEMARKNGLRSTSRERETRERARARAERERLRERRNRGSDRPERRRGDRDRDSRFNREKDAVDRRVEREVSRKPCKFYLEGKCHKGNDCPFSHDVQVQRKKEICKFYLHGGCGKGDNCLFMHNAFPCKFFHTGVECYSGDSCRFSHEPLTDESRIMLRGYLDSGELPDDHARDKDRSSLGEPAKEGEKTADGVTSAPILKTPPKKAAVLGEPTAGMRTSYYTWIWQQEMKDLEMAYTGTKRNLFCIDKEFAMTDRPPTPPPEEFEDPDEREMMAFAPSAPTVASFYIDTLGDTDDRLPPPGAVPPSQPGAVHPVDNQLIEASFHDEDLRLPPTSRLPPPMSLGGGDVDDSAIMSSMGSNQDSPWNTGPFAMANSDPVIKSEYGDDQFSVPAALDPRLSTKTEGQKRPWSSESEEEPADGSAQAAMKRLDQPAVASPSSIPPPLTAQTPTDSQVNGKPKFDIAKMLNVIKQLSNSTAGATAATSATGTTAAAATATPSSKADFWQNMFSGTNYSGPSPSDSNQATLSGQSLLTGPSDPRDPRLRRSQPQSSSSLNTSSGNSATASIQETISNIAKDQMQLEQSVAMSAASGDQMSSFDSESTMASSDWKLHVVTIPLIDYSPYLTYCTGDSKLKNDPRLQKLLGL